ncbi:MAG: sporulation transcriptional regulator SpoIIID [Clostridia bacterium]|nr:sporulation transcriptional regulator SpoIIID [Clostridia bacterium]
MSDNRTQRVRREANFIVETGSTVRTAAQKFRVCKSTIHYDITVRLKEVDPVLYKNVRVVLDRNMAERHIRGGMAMKEKCAKKKT